MVWRPQETHTAVHFLNFYSEAGALNAIMFCVDLCVWVCTKTTVVCKSCCTFCSDGIYSVCVRVCVCILYMSVFHILYGPVYFICTKY